MSTATKPIAVPQVEAARMLSVSEVTLRAWDKKGLISSQRIAGGKRLYLIADIERLVRGERKAVG